MSLSRNFNYTRRKVICRAKRDGRGWRYGIWPFRNPHPVSPADNQTEEAAYETELLKAGEKDLTLIAGRWSHMDVKLKTEYCQSKFLLDQATMKLNEASVDLEFAKKEFDKAEDDFEALSRPPIRKIYEISLILFLGISEYFLNYLVFTQLGAEDFDTHIIAAGVSVMFPLLALCLGYLLKKADKKPIEKIFIVLLGLLPFLALIGISVLRSSMFEAVWADNDSPPAISPLMASVIFISLNLLIYLIGAVVSYNSTHPEPEKFRTLKYRLKMAKKRLRKESLNYLKEEKEYEAAKLDFEKKKNYRKEIFDTYVADAVNLINTCESYISIYRSVNIHSRMNGVRPPCFKNDIKVLKLPESLQPAALDWSCNPDQHSYGTIIAN